MYNITLASGSSDGMTHKQIAIETLKNQGLKEDEILEKLDMFLKDLEKFVKISLTKGVVSLFPKISELLQVLSVKKYILGLVTGNTKIIAFAKLKKAQIDTFFTVGGFWDDSVNREELVKFAIQRAEQQYCCSFNNSDIFVIGDTPKDISVAKKFHLQTIGVATGIYSKSDLKKSGADFVVDNLENIQEIESIIQ